MAGWIGYETRAFDALCKRHGLRVLNPATLKIVLINQQRITSKARAWCRSFSDEQQPT